MSGATIQPQDGNTYRIAGELNMQTVPALLQEVEQVLNRTRGEVCFDLQQVNRSDSAGLALLVEWMQFARQRQRELTFKNLPQQMQDIARVSGLDGLLPLV
jgi:phospholipid transport system transporter-binding protein